MPSSSGPVRAVVDTNVLVSGLLNQAGTPARILDLALDGTLEPVLCRDILEEYQRVLRRRELSLPAPRVDALMEFLGVFVLPLPVRRLHACADPDDDKFLAAAIEGGASWLITGNVRHYPKSPYRGVAIMSPAEALKRVGS